MTAEERVFRKGRGRVRRERLGHDRKRLLAAPHFVRRGIPLCAPDTPARDNPARVPSRRPWQCVTGLAVTPATRHPARRARSLPFHTQTSRLLLVSGKPSLRGVALSRLGSGWGRWRPLSIYLYLSFSLCASVSISFPLPHLSPSGVRVFVYLLICFSLISFSLSLIFHTSILITSSLMLFCIWIIPFYTFFIFLFRVLIPLPRPFRSLAWRTRIFASEESIPSFHPARRPGIGESSAFVRKKRVRVQ